MLKTRRQSPTWRGRVDERQNNSFVTQLYSYLFENNASVEIQQPNRLDQSEIKMSQLKMNNYSSVPEMAIQAPLTPNADDWTTSPIESFEVLDDMETVYKNLQNEIVQTEIVIDIPSDASKIGQNLEAPQFTVQSLDPAFDFQKSFNTMDLSQFPINQNFIQEENVNWEILDQVMTPESSCSESISPEHIVQYNPNFSKSFQNMEQNEEVLLVIHPAKPKMNQPKKSAKKKTFNPRKATLNLDNLNASNNSIVYNGRKLPIGQDPKSSKHLQEGNFLQLLVWILRETLESVENYTLSGNTYHGKSRTEEGVKALPISLKTEIRRFLVETELLKNEESIEDLDSSMQRVYTKAFNVIRDAENARQRSKRKTARKYL